MPISLTRSEERRVGKEGRFEPGANQDEKNKTTTRSLRHFPIHDAAHVRNALARAPQSPFGDKAMPKIRAAAKKFGIEVSDESSRARQRDYFDRAFPLEGIEILSRAKGRSEEHTS